VLVTVAGRPRGRSLDAYRAELFAEFGLRERERSLLLLYAVRERRADLEFGPGWEPQRSAELREQLSSAVRRAAGSDPARALATAVEELARTPVARSLDPAHEAARPR
jgi:hypothetical protein